MHISCIFFFFASASQLDLRPLQPINSLFCLNRSVRCDYSNYCFPFNRWDHVLLFLILLPIHIRSTECIVPRLLNLPFSVVMSVICLKSHNLLPVVLYIGKYHLSTIFATSYFPNKLTRLDNYTPGKLIQ